MTHRTQKIPNSRLTRRSFGLSWRRAATAALMVGMLGLSACGGSDDSDADADAGAGGGSPAAAGSDSQQDRAQVRLTECLREQGIDLPDPQHVGGPPEIQEELDEALAGPCKEFQDDAFGDVSEEEQSEIQDQVTQFTTCMRENGADIPDFEHGAGPGGPPVEIDQDDPVVRKALEACQDELPRFGPGGQFGPGAAGQ